MSSSVFWSWGETSADPELLYTCFNRFKRLVGYLCTGWGVGITESTSTLGGE